MKFQVIFLILYFLFLTQAYPINKDGNSIQIRKPRMDTWGNPWSIGLFDVGINYFGTNNAKCPNIFVCLY
uniref:Uncharacterized protein n=1 Tax=Acrobeloides nanus TaxID=290746 RepID=A0A914DXR4_9BILA